MWPVSAARDVVDLEIRKVTRDHRIILRYHAICDLVLPSARLARGEGWLAAAFLENLVLTYAINPHKKVLEGF